MNFESIFKCKILLLKFFLGTFGPMKKDFLNAPPNPAFFFWKVAGEPNPPPKEMNSGAFNLRGIFPEKPVLNPDAQLHSPQCP